MKTIKCNIWPLTIGFLVLAVGIVWAAFYRPDLDIVRILGIIVPGLVSALAVLSGDEDKGEHQEAPTDERHDQ